ncbi:MAG: ABC transporter ATP-binding protein [Bacillota bacterium]|nr:ABC transporter ATP-binding protein [Bacillota bacterium]
MYAYETTDLVKHYAGGVAANDGISVAIREGEIFGLLGPNGAGKTTLLRQLMGLLAPTSGSIRLFGEEITQRGGSERVTRLVSYATQRAGALADLNPVEALTITGHLRGMDRGAAGRQAMELVEEFELGGLSNRPMGKLSGGEQRLVGFCMAWMAQRRVIIFDEPTNDLDPSHRRQVWDKIMAVNRQLGTTVILVTHNVVEAEKVLERVGIINQGKVMALGTVGELKSRVDQRVRLEFRLREPDAEPSAILAGVDTPGAPGIELRSMGRGLWMTLVDRRAVRQVLDRLTDGRGIENLDDFRIILPTLEDVYLQLGGGGKLAA